MTDTAPHALAAKQARILAYHKRPDRSASTGQMGLELGLVFDGLLEFDNGRLALTKRGHDALRSYLMSNSEGKE